MIREALLTPNQYSRPQLVIHKVQAIVLHWVGNPGTTAEANRRYFESLKTVAIGKASAHYIIDDKEIVRCIPDSEVAYHCGVPNPADYTTYAKDRWGGEHPNWYTIGVEHCHPDWTGKWTKEVLHLSHALVAGLCIEHQLDPITDIVTHNDITGKDCPLWMVKEPIQLALYRDAIMAILEG